MPNYTLPDGVLKNKLGATDEDKLAVLEADAVRRRLFEVELEPPLEGDFNADHLKAIHQHLFQDVYEWAGHTRDERVTLSDGTVATEPILIKAEGQPFLVGPAIPAALDVLGAKLREADNLRGLPREEFAERAADVMIELNDIHPFREGNGRTQRAFMRELAKEAGHDLDFSVVSAERMVQASIAAHEQGDPSMMRRMFDEISDPTRSALLRDSVAALEKLNFDWNSHYVATLAPGHSVDLVFAGAAGDQFMARTETEILFGKISDLPDPYPERGETFTVTPSPYTQREEDTAHGSQIAEAEVGIDNAAEEATASLEATISHEANAAISGVARLAEGVADMAGRAVDALADGLASLLGGGSSAPPPEKSSGSPDVEKPQPAQNVSSTQTENERSARRAQYLRDFDREVPQESERDADIERDHKGRER